MQVSILDEKEQRIRQKYSIGPRVVDGNVSYYDANGKPFPPTGDPDYQMKAVFNRMVKMGLIEQVPGTRTSNTAYRKKPKDDKDTASA